MFKYLAVLALGLAAMVGGLVVLRGPEIFTLDKLAGLPLDTTGLAGGQPGAKEGDNGHPNGGAPLAGALSDAKSKLAAATLPGYSSDPSPHQPTQKIYDAKGVLTLEQRERYEAALSELEIEGCNRNGSFSYQMRGQRAPRTMRSGESIHFHNGLVLVAHVAGFPSCRVTLSDGGHAVAELSSF